jgi:hypothetical protein
MGFPPVQVQLWNFSPVIKNVTIYLNWDVNFSFLHYWPQLVKHVTLMHTGKAPGQLCPTLFTLYLKVKYSLIRFKKIFYHCPQKS